MTAVLDRVADSVRSEQAGAADALRRLVIDLADGDDIGPDEVRRVLGAAGADVGTLRAAVDRIRERRRLAALRRTLPAREADVRRASESLDALARERDAVLAQFAARECALRAELDEAGRARGEAAGAGAELRRTEDPSLRREYESLTLSIRQADHPAAVLRGEVARATQYLADGAPVRGSEWEGERSQKQRTADAERHLAALRARLAAAEAAAAPRLARLRVRQAEVAAALDAID